MKPNAEGKISFKNSKLSTYSTLQIVVVDELSVMQSTHNLNALSVDPAKRDLSLKKSLDQNKGLTQSRIKKCMQKGQTDFIEDITSSEIMLVDDI